MPTPPKQYPYAIYYSDNSYMIYDLTKADYEALTKAILEQAPAVKVSIGVLQTKDIRAVIKQREEKPKKEKPAVPDLSVDELEYLKESLADIYGEGDIN